MSATSEAHDQFQTTINGIWAQVISGRLSDDDGWSAVGEALTDLREEMADASAAQSKPAAMADLAMVRVTLDVAVDPERWISGYGVEDDSEVPETARGYVLGLVRNSNAVQSGMITGAEPIE
ncbi:hypothetical protein OHA79_09425 [Streptomyces sp. NBC_00841]|uniref:hypothetical protein n=1 Tax=Streptomyces sp. NBC_00841 TaxID=2975847 RepID=UPI002DD946C3|nr:hypothetical protein [Streptomyces sp. NBC_00841]WRZ98035.1 hypothetical protein OHA79_09425 [Streptomyces sp. NBC_00841]